MLALGVAWAVIVIGATLTGAGRAPADPGNRPIKETEAGYVSSDACRSDSCGDRHFRVYN